MQFEKEDILNYCLIDLSDDDGKVIRADGKFFVYNPEAINPEYQHNIVFVHGYNTDFFYAMETASSYYDFLKPLIKNSVNFIGIYWPGNTNIDFSKAVTQASKSAPNFASALNFIFKNSKAQNPFFSFIAHSLGNRECVQAALELKSSYGITPIKNFIQLAPAIDANSYVADFKDVPQLIENIIVYFSKNDKVLIRAYETWSDFSIRLKPPFFRWDSQNKAMGYLGPFGAVPKTVKPVNANAIAGIAVDHGTYLSNQKLIQSVAQYISN